MSTPWTRKEFPQLRAHPSKDLERLHVLARNAAAASSDFHQHVSMVTELARQVTHMTEMGVRGGVSTNGWLYGLASAHSLDGKRRTYVGYDLDLRPFVKWCNAAHQALCAREGVDIQLHQGSVLDVDIEETELLFIDTLHVYGQLKRELAKHADKVTWRIALHDTTVDWRDGEIRRRWKQSSIRALRGRLWEGGWNQEDTDTGLMLAVHEFLDEYEGEWVLLDNWRHNNGFTIFQRIAPPGTAATLRAEKEQREVEEAVAAEKEAGEGGGAEAGATPAQA